ncbi:Spy/CpxP family protein refolding chaperone [Sunxiuqinia indica]|uniref:Spy/CpxP family protein refolding chaperone n=1 Tax=Sunxiuqinia indica TaxID=2692584 RepID=UPI0013596887|nr:Spy/CpxP family protein refolding chaperone [Sunxiuqinia indica]
MKKMKKLVIIATALLFMAGYSASAQTGHDHDQKQDQKQGMMMQKSGMMQGMMGNGKCPMCGQMMNQNMPMKKYGMMVNKLPTMQQQLSLTDDQVNKLYDLQATFKKQQIDFQSELRKKQMKLKGLLADNATASQVEKQMKDCADTKISMKVTAYETAGKMKAVLTNDQKEQMKNMMMQSGGMMQGNGGMMNQDQGGMMQNQNNQ